MKNGVLSVMIVGALLQSMALGADSIGACPARAKCDINKQLARNTDLLDELIDKAANMLAHPDAFKDNTLGQHVYVEKTYKPGSFYPKTRLIKSLRLDYEGVSSTGNTANFQIQYGRGAKNQGGCYASVNIPLNTKISKNSFRNALIKSLQTGIQYCISE
ncbi:MAG: hypothetical protein K2X53_03475 [Alphaproteobacteria bacterium]|nr:hypothetical protein [Alphaproteobacteria bacterium]